MHLKDVIEFLEKMLCFIGFGVTVCEISRLEISKNCWVSKNIMKLYIFKGWYLANGGSESNNSQHFLRELNKIFQMHINILSKLWLSFFWHKQKIQKCAIFDILMTITRGVNMVTRQMTPFSASTLWALSVGIFHFCISRPLKFSSMGSLPTLYYVLICKIHIYMPKITLSSLLR